MTAEQVRSLNIGLDPTDAKTVLMVESALEWVERNTTLEIDMTNLSALPASVRLFVSKFCEVNMLGIGVQSESIEGLSQSFTSNSKSSMVWDIAEELLSPYLKSYVRVVSAKRVW